MAKGHLSEGQALWWPAGSAENSSFCSNDGRLHLAFEEKEEQEEANHGTPTPGQQVQTLIL